MPPAGSKDIPFHLIIAYLQQPVLPLVNDDSTSLPEVLQKLLQKILEVHFKNFLKLTSKLLQKNPEVSEVTANHGAPHRIICLTDLLRRPLQHPKISHFHPCTCITQFWVMCKICTLLFSSDFFQSPVWAKSVHTDSHSMTLSSLSFNPHYRGAISAPRYPNRHVS